MKTLSTILIICLAGFVFAQEPPLLEYNIEAFQLTQQFTAVGMGPPDEQPSDISLTEPPKKSPGKAMLLSFMLPGAGELYAGSKLKAALFFCVEVAAWTGTAVYLAEGRDKEDKYERYANEHWIKEDYWSWLMILESDDPSIGNLWAYYMELTPFPANPDTFSHQLYNDFEDSVGFSHNLPKENTQQYYEMIGKYMVQFGAGWDDADSSYSTQVIENKEVYYWGNSPNEVTGNSEFYMNVRHESNKALDRSAAFLQVVMLNHVFSALDAGFTVRLKNRRIETAMDIVPKRYHNETLAMGRITVNW